MGDSRLMGVFVPVVTPFEKDEIRFDWLKNNIDKLNENSLSGYLALGSNGEFMSLSDDEQLAVVQVFMENRKDKIVMVGVSRESTKSTIEFSKKVIDLGADYLSILPPHYFPKLMKNEVLIDYFTEIADRVSIPVLVYNAPEFASGLLIPPDVIKTLSCHPNIVGMKDSSPAGMNSYLAAVVGEENFAVLAGSADFFYSSLNLGAKGGIISMSNYLPKLCCEFYDAIRKGESVRAKELHYLVYGINRKVSGKYGVCGVKAAMNITGFRGGDPRRPLVPISSEDKTIMKDYLVEKGLI
ncbi:MAG: dihydrodipicolinate synthase family protein [Rectinemataceae bacterium]|jgi:4-hydroxy-2-oxoglutarate aldolase